METTTPPAVLIDLIADHGFTSRIVGQEWVRPTFWLEAGNPDHGTVRPFGGYVAIRSTDGWLLLAETHQITSEPRIGQLMRRLLRSDELPTHNGVES